MLLWRQSPTGSSVARSVGLIWRALSLPQRVNARSCTGSVWCGGQYLATFTASTASILAELAAAGAPARSRSARRSGQCDPTLPSHPARGRAQRRWQLLLRRWSLRQGLGVWRKVKLGGGGSQCRAPNSTRTCVCPLQQPPRWNRFWWTLWRAAGNGGALFHFAPGSISLERVSPLAGRISGGTTCTIHGSGFWDLGGSTHRCSFSNVGAVEPFIVHALFISSTKLTCVSPAQTVTGTASIRVSLNAQQYSKSSLDFTYYVAA